MPAYREHRYRSASGGLDLFARDYVGEGPPLLLMHGLTRNSADFEPLAEELTGRYRLIVPDQRGRGLSANDPDPARYRPDVYASDMFALLDGLEVAQVALIGTSMGGLMAMIMAALKPALVSAVVLNDVGPELDPAGLARIASYVGPGEALPDWQAAADRCEVINRSAFPDFTSADWDAFARRTCREREDGSVAFAYDPAIAQGFASPADGAQPDLWRLWQALGAKPVLILRGELSDLLAERTVERMASSHQGPFARQTVPGRGHAPLLDEPASLAAIEMFLKEHA